jgi:FkbM family methyltransferase
MFSRLADIDIGRSVKALRGAIHDDRSFHALGVPYGWYLRCHYQGRLNDRLRRPHPFRRLTLDMAGRKISLKLSEPYMGALKGIFIDREYDCSKQIGFAPTFVLDVGANIGFGSIYLSTIFPSATFALVEPDPRNIGPLKENLSLNGMDGIAIIQAAVGPTNGTLNLQCGADPTCSTLEGTSMHNNEHAVPVQVLSMPEVLKKLGWPQVDLMKVDIEGAEEMLLASNTDWLRVVRAILIEIHPNTTFERICAYLSPYGFTLSRLGSGREPVYFGVRQPAL